MQLKCPKNRPFFFLKRLFFLGIAYHPLVRNCVDSDTGNSCCRCISTSGISGAIVVIDHEMLRRVAAFIVLDARRQLTFGMSL